MPRPPKPTRLKILEGVRPDRINFEEPQSPPGLGDPPAWLDDFGREAWRDMASRLGEMKLATRADASAVALYCVNYSTWRRAIETIDREGMTLETDYTVKAHPLITVANEAQRTMLRILGQFGMTPSSRPTMHVTDRAEEDELMKFIAGRSGAK